MELEQLGPYRLGRMLGRGAMGTVFEGSEIKSGAPVAVKVLSPAIAREEGFRERFNGEIQTLQVLDHPNIVRLTGSGEQAGHLYYAMQLVCGTNLQQELRRRGRFDWREAVPIVVEICHALKHAHDRGVIHRDIKPANVLLSQEGQVKLSDFGIARLFGARRLTATGNVIGTAEYMAPEQAAGRPATPQSDLYSLGVVLYAMLVGRPPFEAGSFLELLQLQRYSPPVPVRQHAPDVPPGLEAIVNQLLEKEPEKRPRNATILRRQLEALQRALAGASSRPGETADATRASEESDLSLAEPQTDRSGNVDPFAPTAVISPPQDADRATEVAIGSEASATPHVPVGTSEAGRPVGPPPSCWKGEDEGRDYFGWIVDVSPQTWTMTFVLLLLGVGMWFLLQPPSADGLYERVLTVVEHEPPDDWGRIESDVQEFLSLFPSDRRCAEMLEWQNEIEVNRLERTLERWARGFRAGVTLSPIEIALAEAIDYEDVDPEKGAAALRAAIDLYGPESDASPAVQRCLAVAERRLERMNERAVQHVAEAAGILDERLGVAQKLSRTEPIRAQAMLRGIIVLYGDKSWAQEFVRRAREILSRTKPSTDRAPLEDLKD